MNTKEKSHIINRIRKREQRKMVNYIRQFRFEYEREQYQQDIDNIRQKSDALSGNFLFGIPMEI